MTDSDYPRPHLKDLAGKGRSEWISVVCIGIVILLLAVVLFPAFAQHKGSGRNPLLSNLEQIDLGLIMYAGDNDDRYPRAHSWMDSAKPYVYGPNPGPEEQIFHDPIFKDKADYGYAFRRKLSGLKMDKIDEPAKMVAVFDSTLLGRNATSELGTLPQPGRHNGSDVLAFADGHVRAFRVSESGVDNAPLIK